MFAIRYVNTSSDIHASYLALRYLTFLYNGTCVENVILIGFY